ncbi:hypothetical protein ACPXCX_50675, partial [Streptomyces sp. DT225]
MVSQNDTDRSSAMKHLAVSDDDTEAESVESNGSGWDNSKAPSSQPPTSSSSYMSITIDEPPLGNASNT